MAGKRAKFAVAVAGAISAVLYWVVKRTAGPFYLRCVVEESGEERESRDGGHGVHRVQTPQLQHAKKQAKDHRAARAEQVLPVLPQP